MREQLGSYVDGRWQPSSADAVFPVINPYTEEQFGAATVATELDVDAAVSSAHRALSGAWRDTTLEERIAMVLLVRKQLQSQADELAAVTSSSMGAPYQGYRNLCNALELSD